MHVSSVDEKLSVLDPSSASLQKLLDEVGQRLALFVDTIDYRSTASSSH